MFNEEAQSDPDSEEYQALAREFWLIIFTSYTLGQIHDLAAEAAELERCRSDWV